MYNKAFHSTPLNDKKILITGGAGFIGSNLVEYLLKFETQKVRVLDNFSTGHINNLKPFLLHPNFELIEGDIRNYETCVATLKDIDFVLHQAALGSVPRSIEDPITTNEVNISGFLNILTAAKNKGIKRLVYAASSSTYGDSKNLPKVEDIIGNPLSPYAVSKLVNELYAKVFSTSYQFPTIGLRYFNVFGPKQNPKGAYAAVIPLFVQSMLQNNAPNIYGDGLTSRDFTFIENVVQANIKALFVENIYASEVFNIAYGSSTTLIELWKKINKLGNVNISPNYLPERKGDIKHSLANIDKAKKILAYNPEFSIDDGLAITINWYRDNPYHFEKQ
ncbi:SDR family oxidoreductase [Hydrotalea sp.]|uniref:SDR family oxidoreductase n=1 Tax=Hydrotalea sp. TaxID=2881279 RepID=UPI003D14A6A8